MKKEEFAKNLKKIGAQFQGAMPDICDVVDDTREVKKGDLYVLRQGVQPLTVEQSNLYIQKSIEAGAVAILYDPELQVDMDLLIHNNIYIIHLVQPHCHLREIAECFYGSPSKNMKMIAVTGTNGKTTTTYLIESIAKKMGLRVGVLGTISYRYPGFEESSNNTTPGTLKLYRLLSAMVSAHCDLVAMEVSSHGIVQGRIDGVYFDAAIWNNLGTDHLDYHVTREAYALAKQRLFDHYLVESFKIGKRPVAIANLDDEEVMHHIRHANPDSWGGQVRTFSIDREADIFIQGINWRDGAYHFEIHGTTMTEGSYVSSLPLIGNYNLYNAAGAVCAMAALGYPVHQLANALSGIEQIPGRMECVHTHHPVVVVDFAHTPEALEKALDAARDCVPRDGKLYVVFGAGGDRDPSKRPMMGKAAQSKADICVVTSDNPRTEDPLKIIEHILSGMTKNDQVVVEVDRKKAIEWALHAACSNDLVLIAGKGHEDYQILGMTKIHFDDREIVRAFYGTEFA